QLCRRGRGDEDGNRHPHTLRARSSGARRSATSWGAAVGRVVDRAELLASARAWHHAAKTIALANGHFDLMHVGHLRYLRAAKREADVLGVAINDDDSVARLKGAGRPG